MTSNALDGSGYQSRGRLSPAALGGVVIVHVGLGAAILSMTVIDVFHPEDTPIWVRNIIAQQPKAEPVPPRPRAQTRDARAPKDIDMIPQPQIDLPSIPTSDFIRNDPLPPAGTGTGTGTGTGPTLLPDPAPPVLVQARPDSRFARDFQPDYPAAMLRLQKEGDVTVRVQIGADGHVVDVALVSTADPAFFEAARRQALSRWRFLPATRDGVPVASERVMTVHFTLTD